MTTRNRGKQSSDDIWFAPKWHAIFTEATNDLCYLLTRGYASNSSVQLVGNRYRLNKRQQSALSRIAASDQQVATRQKSCCTVADLKNKTIHIDGFNLLILLESALSGVYIFKGRDGAYRDISSVHGSYKRVVKTEEAIAMVGNTLKEMEVGIVKWYLDQPVSNSGRLKTMLMNISKAHEFNWEVELVFDPDKVLAKSEAVVVSADSWVLDEAKEWFNLSAHLLEEKDILVF